MKVVLLLLLLAGLAHCQRQNFRSSPRQFTFSNEPAIHARNGNSVYHLTWAVNPSASYKGDAARNYCDKLGTGWSAVAIGSRNEYSTVLDIFNKYPTLPYIWTGGVRRNGGFVWSNGEKFDYTDWSFTGGPPLHKKQPDNRQGDENCLAVLRNVYNDGIKWHDVHCDHAKPVLCEKQ